MTDHRVHYTHTHTLALQVVTMNSNQYIWPGTVCTVVVSVAGADQAVDQHHQDHGGLGTDFV